MKDLGELTALIRRQAGAARREADADLVALAAHLFAVTQELLKARDAELVSRVSNLAGEYRVPSVQSLEEILVQLEGLQAAVTPAELYALIGEALRLLESEIISRPADHLTLPRSTQIETLRYEGKSLLGGTVLHWARAAPSSLRSLRTMRNENAPPSRPQHPAPHPAEFLDRLRFYWVRPQLLDVEPVPHSDRAAFLIHESGREASHPTAGFRIALCPLICGSHPRFRVLDRGHLFTTVPSDPIHAAHRLIEHLDLLLHAAEAQRVHLLLLPELCVDEAARAWLEARLLQRARGRTLRQGNRSYPWGIVAGSFHVPHSKVSEGPPTPAELPVNEAILLDHQGRVLARHHKRGRFELPGSVVKASPKFFPLPSPRVAPRIAEGIQSGTSFQVLETSLGTLAILICADALEADPQGYPELCRELRPDLLLMVCMSPETERFESFVHEMAEHGIGTVLVNAHCICSLGAKNKAPLCLALAHLALFEPRGAPRTVWRWCHRRKLTEWYSLRSSEGKKGWRALASGEEPPEASWLVSQSGRRLGFLLDLGPHWQWQASREQTALP